MSDSVGKGVGEGYGEDKSAGDSMPTAQIVPCDGERRRQGGRTVPATIDG